MCSLDIGFQAVYKPFWGQNSFQCQSVPTPGKEPSQMYSSLKLLFQFSSHLQFASQTPSLHRSVTISVSISFAVCITDFIFWFHFTVPLEISSHLMFQPNFIPLMNSSWIFSSQTYLTSQTSSFDLIFQIKSIFAKLSFHKIHIYNDQHSSNSYSQ